MSTSASEAKKAEIARLFELFEKLKSRRTRPTSIINEDASMEDPKHMSEQQPSAEQDQAIKALSNIVERSSTSTRPRRNTVASMIALGGTDMMYVEEGPSESDAESLAKFPLAERKRFPFTFKHMVHKLYEKDDWVKTIKDMLERSQNEFKPLAEQQKTPRTMENDKKPAHEGTEERITENFLRFDVAINPTRRRGSFAGRQRSLSIATTGGGRGCIPLSPGVRSPGFKVPAIKSLGPGMRSPGSAMMPHGVDEKPDIRALKKRCVGRRKSASGLVNQGATDKRSGSPRRVWVYNAAISASERPVPTTFAEFPSGEAPSPSAGTTSFRYQGLGTNNLPSMLQVGGMAMKRRVIPATDAPVATSFAAFHPGPPPSPTGGKGSSSRYQALGIKNLPTAMQGRSLDMKRRVVPATDAPATVKFAGFPPGPPPSPTGPSKGFLTKYSALGPKNLPSTLKERGKPGLKRRGSIEDDGMNMVPIMMPLQQVTNLRADGLAGRRRLRMASKSDDAKCEEKTVEQRDFGNQTTI